MFRKQTGGLLRSGSLHAALAGAALSAVCTWVLCRGGGAQSPSSAPALPKGLWERSATLPPGEYRIALVADLDKASRVSDAKKPTFQSLWKEGTLKLGADRNWSVAWDDNVVLSSQYNEGGRGMELSELVKWEGRIYTFDDRSGIVYEVLGDSSGKRRVVPRWLLTEGDGDTAKGQKTEWATVRDGVLYAGSFGKEYVDPKDGITITSKGNLWVSTIDQHGAVRHEDWTEIYETIRRMTGSVFPAYQIIETILWSDVHRKWFVLPRRVSQEPYDEVKDEKRGSNVVITCDGHFTGCTSFVTGRLTPERGFSSAKFLPDSGDSILVALKSEEDEAAGTQGSFITIFDTQGRTLMPETPVPGGDQTSPGKNFKFEGLVFI